MTKRSKPQMRSDYPKAAQAKPNKKRSINVLTIKDAYARLRAMVNIKRKGKKTMAKNTKTNKPAEAVLAPKKGNGIIGMLMLLVALSIAYSSYVVWFGTNGTTPKILLAPQIAFVAATLVYAFWKATTK